MLCGASSAGLNFQSVLYSFQGLAGKRSVFWMLIAGLVAWFLSSIGAWISRGVGAMNYVPQGI